MKNIDKSYKQRSPIVKSRELETEHRPAMEALQERLQFEKLISDLSALFVNLPASEVDGQIEQGLKRIVEFLTIDRSSFGEFSEDMKELRGTHSYAVPGIEPIPRNISKDVWPWYENHFVPPLISIESCWNPSNTTLEGLPTIWRGDQNGR